MSKIALSGPAGGTATYTVTAPTGAIDRVITLPDNTGTLISTASTFGGTGPAFSAYQSTLQSIASSTLTKIQLQIEEFDTNSNFDSTTNYRFTPTVAGYYQVNGSFAVTGSAATLLCSIYKNGAEFKRGVQSGAAASSGAQSVISALIYMNGSTDYIELYGFQNSGGALNTAPGIQTYFQAFLARSA
jgi:hypothetical protein